MKKEHVSELLRPYVALDEKSLGNVSKYIDLLLKWNARINLTAIRQPEEIVTRHFGESFFAAKLLSPTQDDTVIDLGSGAGFPGLPLAMIYPKAKVVLIESNSKKAAFLNAVVSELGLSDVQVFNRRGEEHPGGADLVTMRAVEKFEKALLLAIQLAERGGRIGLLIGNGQIETVQMCGKDVDWAAPTAIPGGNSRVLLTGIKRVTVE